MNIRAISLSVIVFVACLMLGFWIASQRPLWNDEFYSQASNVEGKSFIQIWQGGVDEGNNTPLFYTIQKLLCALAGHHPAVSWKETGWQTDPRSQLVLRIIPVTAMSLSIALIFYYFSYRYSLLAGCYSLFIYASSYMLWAYWAEARPYNIVVLLTTVQSLIFLEIVERKSSDHLWIGLGLTHILLALTSILTLGSIAAVSFLLWVIKERSWVRHLFWFIIPVLCIVYYYAHAPQYAFYFGLTPEQLMRDNFSRQNFYIFLVFLAFVSVYWLGGRFKWLRSCIDGAIVRPVVYGFLTLLVLLATGALLFLFELRQSPSGGGFPIPSRYFIYLMPVGVIGVTAFSVAIVQSLNRFKWAQGLIILGCAWLLIPRFIKIVSSAFRSINGG